MKLKHTRKNLYTASNFITVYSKDKSLSSPSLFPWTLVHGFLPAIAICLLLYMLYDV